VRSCCFLCWVTLADIRLPEFTSVTENQHQLGEGRGRFERRHRGAGAGWDQSAGAWGRGLDGSASS
jgi:hypothetical protein